MKTGKLCVVVIWTLLNVFLAQASDLSLWYKQDAGDDWNKSLPLGNGSLAVMIYGGVEQDKLMYNLDSLWTGWPELSANREGAVEQLEKARQLLREGKDREAYGEIRFGFMSHKGYSTPSFGRYQAFCDAILHFPYTKDQVEDYRRQLDLTNGLATVSYQHNDVDYRRETFASYPANAIVTRVSSSKEGALEFVLAPQSHQQNATIEAKPNGVIELVGQTDNGENNPEGMKFAGIWQVQTEGGSIVVGADGKSLEIKEATSATIIFVAKTNYELEYPEYRLDAEPLDLAQAQGADLWERTEGDFDLLYQEHLGDYSALFSRVDLDLGEGKSDLPTDERLRAYKQDPSDRALEAQMFQFGRYLMIACSRPGTLPANLQGIWNDRNDPPWCSDYHLNINFQMNYWPADLCNLSPCFEPVTDWVEDLTKPGAETARIHYGTNGWVAHISGTVWGSTAPGPARGPQMTDAAGGAFICQNLWSHWDFTRDQAYLERIWPILWGASEFWMENLQEAEEGYLYVSPSYSPEQPPMCDAAYFQPMIVWDLLNNTAQAAAALGQDAEVIARLEDHRDRIIKPAVGEFGQLLEWFEPELERTVGGGVENNQHRHFSHLFAVYPGEQIVAGRDQELMEAARVSMNYRGDGATGWSLGWKVNFWARLLDGDRAHLLMRNFLSERTAPNLWCLHPPFQIDGNFGYTAGVAEMLIQSHTDEIVLLPALPEAWHTGEVKGLRARGNFEFDLRWENGELVEVTVQSDSGLPAKLRVQDQVIELELEAGETTTLQF